jgi:hypothetical protein
MVERRSSRRQDRDGQIGGHEEDGNPQSTQHSIDATEILAYQFGVRIRQRDLIAITCVFL